MSGLNNQRPVAPNNGALSPRPAGAPGVIHRRNPLANPDYTEFGIKIHKLRLTLKVQRRASSCSNRSSNSGNSINVDPGTHDRHGRPRLGSEDRSRTARARQQQQQQQQQQQRSHPRRRPRPTSTTSSMIDSLKNLDLDSEAGSRRPVVQDVIDGAAMSSSSSRGGAGTRVANWEFQVRNF